MCSKHLQSIPFSGVSYIYVEKGCQEKMNSELLSYTRIKVVFLKPMLLHFRD
jgi:hypothetical protein